MATVSVASSVGAFVFEVAGTGVATNTIAAPTQSDNTGVVQEGTTKSGSGAGAVNGEVMGVLYTGYLVSSGKVFDASTLHGNVPLKFRLDDDFLATTSQPYINNDQSGDKGVDFPLIAGFEYGLQGAKVGEKRTLVINSAAGYGANGSGASIPGGASLVFEIEVVSLSVKPELVVEGVSGSGSALGTITAGQKVTAHRTTRCLRCLRHRRRRRHLS